MRDFFKQLLKDLEVLTGYQQYNKLQQMPDGGEKCKRLLDELEKSANKFGNIPEDLKKLRLEKAIYKEGFMGVTPRWVYIVLSEYWENTYRQIYQHEKSERERAEQEKKYLKNRPTPEKEKEYMDKFRQQVAEADKNYNMNHKTKYAGTRIKESWTKQ